MQHSPVFRPNNIHAGLLAPCLWVFLLLCWSQAALADESLARFRGDYRGAFDTALSADPLDDMNTNPCPDCDVHGEPLKDIVLRIHLEDGTPRPGFYREPQGPAIDLLGKYCNSRIGKLEAHSRLQGKGRDSNERYSIERFDYSFEPGRCQRNIPLNKEPMLSLILIASLESERHFARVEIDRDLRTVVSLSARNREGERAPVKSSPEDYGTDRRATRSFVYEDEPGSDSIRRRDTTETRYFALPLALHGYVGAGITWWPHRPLKVKAESESVLSRHVGIFQPLAEPDKSLPAPQ